jgi:predicted phosphodiesterase
LRRASREVTTMQSVARRGVLSVSAGLGLAILALIGACSSTSAPAPKPYESAPYVQQITTSTAVVAQATRFATALTVKVTPAVGGPTMQQSESEPLILHRLRFEGLQPDSLYSYQVVTAGAVSFVSSFRTAPPRGGRVVRFAGVGDSGGVTSAPTEVGPLDDLLTAESPEPQQPLVVRAMVGERPLPEFVIHTGDVVYPNGDYTEYREGYFDPFLPLIAQVPVFAVIGNHDVKTQNAQPWLDTFVTPANNPERSPRYYSFDWGDVHVVALDVQSTQYSQGTPQWQFLKDDLASSPATWKIVTFHRPPFSDSRQGDEPTLISNLVPVFEQERVDLVLTGHDHNYQRFKPMNGVTYVVTGGGGYQNLYDIHPSPRLAYGNKTFHFVRGTADRTRLTLEAIDEKGILLDTVTLTKEPTAAR